MIAISGTDMQSVASMDSNFQNLKGVGHQYANECCLTGDHRGASIDYLVSESLSGLAPYKRVLLEVSGGWAKEISFDGNHQPLNYYTNNQAAFNNFFGNNFNPSSLSNSDLETQFGALFSQVNEEFVKIKKVISADDVMRIDSHVNALEDFRNQILSDIRQEGGFCNVPGSPIGGFASGGSGTERSVAESLGLIGNIFSCDISRVATLQIHGIQSGTNYAWLPGASNRDHHGVSHHDGNSAAIRELVNIRKWHAEQIKSFLDQISNMPDGSGESVLDNTIFLWSTEISEPRYHAVQNMPYLIVAGKNTGLMQGGNHLNFPGRSTNDLFASIAKAMDAPIKTGVTGDARFHIGENQYNIGPLDIFA